jgi:hypothetical protein
MRGDGPLLDTFLGAQCVSQREAFLVSLIVERRKHAQALLRFHAAFLST